jgi:hypothetical protein
VDYYPHTQGGNPRWALPDHIATSKLDERDVGRRGVWNRSLESSSSAHIAFEFSFVHGRASAAVDAGQEAYKRKAQERSA